MRVVHDPGRIPRSPDTLTVDDLLSAEAFDAESLGREYLTETTREPRKFLPPPRVRPRRQAAPPREPESRLSKVAKLAGLTTAASLLVGAVVASSMVTRARTEQTGRAVLAPPPITGAAALGGFAVPGTGKARHSQPSPITTTTTQAPLAQTRSSAPAGSAPSATTTTIRTSTSDTDKLAVVNEFYQRMGSQRPEDALAMLAPGLAGDQPGDLVRAWCSMSRIHVDEAHVQPDGSVRAVVTMLQRDGTRLRVTQVLGLAANATGAISQAVLLSAEQL